jgi:hypothetical protein
MNKTILWLTSALTLASAAGAFAQDVRDLPVPNRPRPEYDPAGIPAGSFLVLPSVTFTAQYDDNIFADERGKVSDYVFVLSPNVAFNSNWNNHALNFNAGAELGRNKDFKSENYNDWHVATDGRLDVLRDMAITAGAAFERAHEDRGSPNDVGGAEPTEYDRVSANVGVQKKITRITMQAGLDFRDFDFHNTRGGIIDENLRDRKEYTGTARVGYELIPNVSAFAQGSYNWRRYDLDKPRNSDGYRVVAGTSFDLGGVTSGEVFVGYRRQTYDDPAFSPASGVTYGGSLLWLPTGLTSVELTLLNEVEETIQGSSSGYVTNAVTLNVDHELLRNLLLGAKVAYNNNDYKGLTRNDDVWQYGVSAKYLFSRNFRFQAEYRRETRSSNLVGADYKRNIVMLGVTAAL